LAGTALLSGLQLATNEALSDIGLDTKYSGWSVTANLVGTAVGYGGLKAMQSAVGEYTGEYVVNTMLNMSTAIPTAATASVTQENKDGKK